MTGYGLALMSEEHPPGRLVEIAVAAEAAGFDFAMITDHYQPWTSAQGQSSFVWSVLGAIATATSRLTVGTAVVCPTMRQHPTLVAQAAATVAALLPERFLLGVGSGGALNEHTPPPAGPRRPPTAVRQEMLAEAVALIRRLWTGRLTSWHGTHFQAIEAQLWSLPARPPPILVAAGGPRAAALAGRIGDGLIATAPDPRLVTRFLADGDARAPRYGWVSCCWAADLDTAQTTAHRRWPIAALRGDLFQELRLPRHVEQATALVRPEDVAAVLPLGPHPARYVERITAFIDAGFTHVWVHQIGDDQEGFLRFWTESVRPLLPGYP
jgi:coenzyme F420-dependent glucose-6-phosphate dehydrogenase